MIPKWTKHEAKNGPGAVPEPTDSPDEPNALQKIAERAHRQPRLAKRTQKNDTSTPKETTKATKGCQKRPPGLQKEPKMMEKQEKKRQVETLLFKIEKVSFTCMGALYCLENELPCGCNVVVDV